MKFQTFYSSFPGTVFQHVNSVLSTKHYYEEFISKTISRESYYNALMNDKINLINAGLDEKSIHLAARMPVDNEEFVDSILSDLVKIDILKTNKYSKEDFKQFKKNIESSFHHKHYCTYIFPEEERLMFAIGEIIKPTISIFLGSYYGYWGAWLLPHVKKNNGKAIFLDINPEVNRLTQENINILGYTDFCEVITEDGVEFLSKFKKEIDFAVLDAECPSDFHIEEYRGKKVYYPLTKSCYENMKKGSIMLAHNIMLSNLNPTDHLFANRVKQHFSDFSQFLPYCNNHFLWRDFPSTEGLGVFFRDN